MQTQITNNGSSSATLSVSAGGPFSASGLNGTVLAPNGQARLMVTFTPTTGAPVTGASVSVDTGSGNVLPLIIPLSGTGQHWVRLTWGPSATAGVTYNVFRGTESGQESTTPLVTSLTTTTYQDTEVTAGQEYFYTVEAVLNGASSVPSPEASVTIPSP
jgi:fibronectin type 3 domain-containing protein